MKLLKPKGFFLNAQVKTFYFTYEFEINRMKINKEEL
jgi:hypothetical protein